MEPAIGHREGRLGYHARKRYTKFGSCERLRRKAWQLDLKTRPSWATARVDDGRDRSHGAAEAEEEAKAPLDWGEQMARRLVAMRLANLHETTTDEEDGHEPNYSFPSGCLRSRRSRSRQDGPHLFSPTLPRRSGRHRALAQDGQRLAEVRYPPSRQAPGCERAWSLPDLPGYRQRNRSD